MEGLLNIRERLRKHDRLLSSLEYAINKIGSINISTGSPEGNAVGRWYYDATNQNLYFNPNPDQSTGWVLIS